MWQDSTRELSLEVITGLCESAPSVLREGGGGVVGAVVPLTINMLAQPPEGDSCHSQADRRQCTDDDVAAVPYHPPLFLLVAHCLNTIRQFFSHETSAANLRPSSR